MKATVIFSILMLPFILRGQIFNHFDNFNSKWNVAKTNPAGNPDNPTFVATTTTVFGFQSDSILNNEQWLKVYSTSDALFQNDLEYRGLLRAENNKVFYLDTLNQLDTLYDFSLNLGDSALFNFYGMYPEWLRVNNIDSIQINGVHYKRWKFEEPSLTGFDRLDEEWIEGIGSIHGLLFPTFPVMFSEEIPDSMHLTCSYSDSQQVWQHPSYSSCYINVVLSSSASQAHDIRIYPNPFFDEIHFENTTQEVFELSIINSWGQLIRRLRVSDHKEKINLADLKQGVYFLTFSGRNGIETVKMIKKDRP